MSLHSVNIIPGSSRDWLARARGDLAIARMPLPDGGFLEDLCFHAQQAGEKAIKAVYIHYGLPFQYIHDLDELFSGLERHDIGIPDEVRDAAILTVYAWESRYPHLGEPIMMEEYHEAVILSYKIVHWAEDTVE